MSQIPHSQLALKKRSAPVIEYQEIQQQKVNNKKSHTNGSSNGHHNKSDKDVIIIDDEFEAIPVGREEIIEEVQEISPSKKKRGRKSKPSTDSRASTSDLSKASEDNSMKFELDKSLPEEVKNELNDEVLKELFSEESAVQTKEKETKILKLSQDQRRSDRLQNASTIVNLSTVSISDQSTKVSNDTMTTTNGDDEATPTAAKPERRVSGRRSTRPIDDIKFTYRSPNADDSLNATTNATIGSEIADSMLETPATDRKRRFDEIGNVDSPKRSRYDISALFTYSPISLLRSKFRRANLASTPKVGGGGLLDDSTLSIDTSASEMKEIDLNEKSGEKIVTVDGDDDEKLQVVVKPIKKTSCSIM